MDQLKIGKFISECRKSKNLTQLQLAEKLFVTDRAVSKWENGRSIPDSSIMLELCSVLDITVNDLLSGEKVAMENNVEVLEKNLLNAIKEKEIVDKKMLNIEIFIGIMSSVVFLGIIFAACFLNIPDLARILLIVGGTIFFIPSIAICISIEQKAGYYVCPNCGKHYVPTYKSVLFAMHTSRTRYMKCPHCGKKGWHKKEISK